MAMNKLVLTVFFLILLVSISYSQNELPGTAGYRLIAHRGGVVDNTTAENSLPALERAIARNYWMVEIDLRLTADSVLIIHHDRNFKRYFGIDSAVSSMKWNRIKELRSNTGSRVLNFEEALRHCQGKIRVMIDNKIQGLDTVLFAKVVALLKKYDLQKDAMMIGTDESTEFFTGKVKLSCTRKQLEENMRKPGYKASDYYLFSGEISRDDVQWANQHNIEVVGVINTWVEATPAVIDKARTKAEQLKNAGVQCFQIDSPFDIYFRTPFTHDSLGENRPFTSNRFLNSPENFQFAIVGDRTNGHRIGVFKDAVTKLNLLQPELVLSVGDLIEGYTTDAVEINRQWAEFNSLLQPLKMPFFRVAGNHDFSNEVQKEWWLKHFGVDYYHFVYKNVLFIVMNSNDGDGVNFSETQIRYVENILKKKEDVRWTFLFMHHPVWNTEGAKTLERIESALSTRPYTMIAGHTHRYLHNIRNNRNYYTLATTGGKTRMRGEAFGETDHISWVTMTDDGPSLVNIKLDGLLLHDFSNQKSMELATHLANATDIKPTILLPAASESREAIVYLGSQNKSELPIEFEARFFQHNRLRPSETRMLITVAPAAVIQRPFKIQFPAGENALNDTLELQWKAGYQSQDKQLPQLDGILKIPVQASVPNLINKRMLAFRASKSVEIINPYQGTEVRYTINGEEPTPSSTLYTSPFQIDRSTDVKAKLFAKETNAISLTETVRFSRMELAPPPVKNKSRLLPGLKYAYYEGAWKKIPDFSTLTALKTGILKSLNPSDIKGRLNQFALLIDGFLEVPEDGLYTFYLSSDDGCRLYIDDREVVDNDGSHSAITKSGNAALKKGIHKIRFEYFEDFDGELIKLEWEKEGMSRGEIPFSNYYYKK